MKKFSIRRGGHMSAIKIVKTPPGRQPEWVRDAWTGLILPAQSDTTLEGPGGDRESMKYFVVETEHAMAALRGGSKLRKKAAKWWESTLYLPTFPNFKFPCYVCMRQQ